MRRRLAIALVALLALAGCGEVEPSPTVRVLCSNEVAICDAWADAFAARSVATVQTVRLPSAEALARLRAPGPVEFDVWHGGPSELYEEAAAEGLLARHVPPSAADVPLSLRDPGGRWTGVYASLLAICSDPVGLADAGIPMPTSWDDLLDERLAGRVSLPSPLASGTASTTMVLHVDRLGDVAGRAYLAGLYANVVQFTRSGPAVANVVASGEALVGVTFAPYCDRRDGLAATLPSDGTAYELGAVAVLAEAASPSLARRYVDLAVDREGQRAGAASGIAQIPTTRLLPGDLESVLDDDDVVIVEPSAIADRVGARLALLDWFRREVGLGA